MKGSGFEAVVEALQRYCRYLIVGHENPDADSIGSTVALHLGLQKMNKRSAMAAAGPAPFVCPGTNWDEFLKPEQIKVEDFDAVVILDCEPTRVGPFASFVETIPVKINIDHHQGNSGADSQFSWVDPKQPATASMIYQVLKQLSLPLDAPMAAALYAGIIGDTGCFRYGNTTAAVLQDAADLVKLGADPAAAAKNIFEAKPWNFMSLVGTALSKMERNEDGSVIWLALSWKDFARHGVDPGDGDSLIQYLRMVAGSEIVVLLRETKPGTIRLGFRSHRFDVGSLARSYGGGGHRLAAGATVAGTLAAWVQKTVTDGETLIRGGPDGETGRNCKYH